MDIGNSNKWFNSQAEAIALYDTLQQECDEGYNRGEITSKEYDQKCPCGYEVWTCYVCGKWTINFYYR